MSYTANNRRWETGKVGLTLLLGATVAMAAPREALPARAPSSAQGSADPVASWLSWAPPPECPSREYIAEKVQDWLGGPIPPDTPFTVTAEVHWREEHWHVRVDIHLDDHSGRRSVAVDRCSDAADFVALATVLALDPNFVAPTEATDKAEESAPGSTVPAERSAQAADKTEPVPPTDSAPSGLRPDQAPTGSTLARDHAEGRRESFIGLGGEASFGALPGFHGGPSAEAGLTLRRLQMALGGGWVPPHRSAPAGAAAPIDFSLWWGRIDGCWFAWKGAISLGPCLNAELGVMQSQQEPEAGRFIETSELWAALGGGAEVAWRPLPWLEGALDAAVRVPLTQPRFLLDDQTLAHRPAIGTRVTGMLRVYFLTRGDGSDRPATRTGRP